MISPPSTPRHDLPAKAVPGQPIGFMIAVIAIWIAGRISFGLYWPDMPFQAPILATDEPHSAHRKEPLGSLNLLAVAQPELEHRPVHQMHGHALTEMPRVFPAVNQPKAFRPAETGSLPNDERVPHMAWSEPVDSGNPALPTAPGMPRLNRWSLTGWAFGRSGSQASALAGSGQYGGSQAGLLLRYRTDFAGSVYYARGTRALQVSDPVVALGAALRPLQKIPLEIAVEHRFALTSAGRSGVALQAVGGGEVSLDQQTRLRSYGQLGIVGLQRRTKFFDLQMVALRSIKQANSNPASLGVGLWAGGQDIIGQKGDKPEFLYRVDIGPRVETKLPLINGSAWLAVDWRYRVAGEAGPGSGPSITLAADF